MTEILLYPLVKHFAENKDVAREIRINMIIPAIKKNEQVIIDFKDVDGATQSFVHALISDLIRLYGNEIIDKIDFKNCNETIKKVITIVVEYMQESQ
jgi:hypothetical protein